MRSAFSEVPWSSNWSTERRLEGLGQLEDIVGPVVFLASSDVRWVTGEVLFTSGGFR
jgi:3-oxoacyl-[acyl-carrier protein] reductase